MEIKKILSLLTAIVLLSLPASAYANTVPSGSKNYIIINNESVDIFYDQPTGSFKINNENVTANKLVNSNGNKLDVNMPIDIRKSKGKVINKKFSKSRAYTVGQNRPFWVENFKLDAVDETYQINPKLAYSGTKANVWVDNNLISAADAEKLGKEFDTKIYQSVTNNFAKESDVNRDGKINILCFDIQDDFDMTGEYVGGYFNPNDLFNYDENSNLSEIFYIDTNPTMGEGTVDVSESYTTLAHEFQHMVNFNQNIFVEDAYDEMDIWLDEAMAMAAEQIYSGSGLNDRIAYYNYSNSIASGHSLLDWEYYGDVLANYSLSYLFGQYVKVQTNQGNSIFKEIMNDPNNDYKAVENAVKRHINPSLTFGKFMTSFRAALLLKQETGLYGFKGDPLFNALQPRVYTGSLVDFYLYGGGAVVTENTTGTTAIPDGKGADVSYTFVSENSTPVYKDTTPPQVNGIKNNAYYNKDVTITFNEGTATLNNIVFNSGTIVKTEGKHTLVVTDAEGKKNTIAFVIDKKAPQVTGATNNRYYNKDIKLTFNEGRATLNGKAFTNGTTVKTAGVYTLAVTDTAGNKTTVKFTIDKTAPKVSGAANNAYYNKDLRLTFNEGKATLNGRSFGSGSYVRSAGTYTLIVTDAAGNKTTLKFFIDKTRPRTPKVNTVKSSSRTVTGTAEAYSTLTVKAGSRTLGTAKADKYGKYKVTIKAQKKRTVLKITVKDRAGNISYTASKTVN